MTSQLWFRLTAIVLFAWVTGCSSRDDTYLPPEWDDNETSDNEPGESPVSDEAMAVIDAAIEAHGGAAKFAQTSIGRVKYETEGEFLPGYSGRMKIVDVFNGPRHLFRRDVAGVASMAGEQEAVHMVFLIENDRSWMQSNHGEPIELPAFNTKYESILGANLNALLALKSGDLEVKMLAENKIRGQAVLGLRAKRDDVWYGNMYFDAETKLAVAARKSLPLDASGITRDIDTYYSDFREVSGLMLPTTIETVLDGKTTATVKITEILFSDAIDDSEFEIPVAGE